MPPRNKKLIPGWPVVGQISQDSDEHAATIKEDARRLLKFGASPDNGTAARQCPYQTLAAFCTSVMAYIESKPPSSTVEVKQPSKCPTHSSNEQSNVRDVKQGHREIKAYVDPIPTRIDTYGVLVLYVPSNFDVSNQQRAIDGISSKNKGFIPGIEIKSIEWLIPEWTQTKHYSTLLFEFARPEHANAAIREQLLVGNKVLACEYFERNSRLRQCHRCQEYGHLETQCNNPPVCGRCSESHLTADCADQNTRRKLQCALCNGRHTTWEKVCPVRQAELDRVRQARANRPIYHPEPGKTPKEVANQAPISAGSGPQSAEFLAEVTARRDRLSHANLRGRGGRGEGLPPDFEVNPTDDGGVLLPSTEGVPARPPQAETSRKLCWGINGKAPVDSPRYSQKGVTRTRPFSSTKSEAEDGGAFVERSSPPFEGRHGRASSQNLRDIKELKSWR